MKKNLVTTLLLIAACNCFAQQITFQKAINPLTLGGYNRGGHSVKQTADGGYIISGRCETCLLCDEYKVSLIKTDANGDPLWIKLYEGANNNSGISVQQTSDGGYIVGGYLGYGTTSSGDGYLIKTDGNGDTLWTRAYGGTNTDGFTSVQQTADGGFIMGGHTKSFGTGNLTGYLVKTDANGDTLWSKIYGGVVNLVVQQTTDGGYIFTDISYSLLSLTKIDSSGNLSWNKTYDAPGSSWGYSVQQTSDGGFIAIGTVGQSPNSDIYLIKTDSTGNLLWSKIISGGGDDRGRSIQQTSDGGYIIGGVMNNFNSLIKTDASGNLVWSWSFNGPGGWMGSSVTQTADGGFIITGDITLTGNFFSSIALVKTDSLGNSGCNQFSTGLSISTPAIVVNSAAITVAAVPTIVSGTATVIGSGGSVTTLCTTVGISSIPALPEGKGVAIAPNPTTSNFIITFPNTINKGNIEIYNVLGKKIFKENVFNVSQKEIRLDNIIAGIYFVKVKDGEKEYCKKLVTE